MGNASSASASDHRPNHDPKQSKNVSPSPASLLSTTTTTIATTKVARPLQGGVAGLREMGFEYRRIIINEQCNDQKDGTAVLGRPCPNNNNNNNNNNANEKYTMTRLFHVESNTMIDATNRKSFIPDGPCFDDIASICQDIAQKRIVQDFDLKYITIPSLSSSSSSSLGGCDGDIDDDTDAPIRAMVNNTISTTNDNNNNHNGGGSGGTLLIITGKGKSRAGILSIKQLLHSGYEYGSAALHLMEAKKRGMHVIILDPNARGASNGMEVVDRSLSYLFSIGRNNNNNDNNHNNGGGGGDTEEYDQDGSWGKKESSIIAAATSPIYVLAHSAAGGYFVRYLLLGQARMSLLNNLHAIAFSDSTHTIQWARNDEVVSNLLQSSKCLYIRNNAIRASEFRSNDDAKPGEAAEVDHWWRRRFGDIPTVWAGTPDHSLVCAVACKVIWSLFDKNQTTTTRTRIQNEDEEYEC